MSCGSGLAHSSDWRTKCERNSSQASRCHALIATARVGRIGNIRRYANKDLPRLPVILWKTGSRDRARSQSVNDPE